MTLIKCAFVAATVVAVAQANLFALLLAALAAAGFVARRRQRA